MSDELRLILEAVHRQGQAIEALLKHDKDTTTSQTPQNTVSQTLMSHTITFEAFDPDQETFKSYIERLENFFTLRQIKENEPGMAEVRRDVLLNCLKSKQYQLLSSLTAPEKPSEKSYNDLVTILDKQFTPVVSVHTERHKFLSRIQKTNETLSNYIAELKTIATRCAWICPEEGCGKQVQSIFQAQFIRGIRDVHIREKILQMEPSTTLEKTLDAAMAMEAARKQNLEEYNKETNTESVNQVKMDSRQRSRSKSPAYLSNKKHYPRRNSNTRNKKDNLIEQLGLQNCCLSCGKNNHSSAQCRSKSKLKCNKCNKNGHVAKVCITSRIKNGDEQRNSNNATVNNITSEFNDEDFSINSIQFIDIYSDRDTNYSKKILIDIKINNRIQKFELDSGSPVTILSQNDYNKLQLNISLETCSNIKFRAYNNSIIVPEGVANVSVQYKNRHSREKLYIVPGDVSPILGRVWIRKLKIIDLDNINQLELGKKENVNILTNRIFQKFPNVFNNMVGEIPDVTCSLKLRPEAKPVYVKPRPVPYALLPKVNAELDTLEKQGIIQKTEYCPWGTPLVIIPKADQGVRICADYKITVNKQLVDAHYPIPRIAELFTKLKDGNYYCILDIKKAYLHLKLDEESAKIAAISTHRGTYLAKRLFFGLKTAPNIFHSVIDPIINDIEGCVNFFDDIAIQGSTLDECYERVTKCIQRLDKFNIKLNRDKCKFFVDKINYLGYVISNKGLEKDPQKIEAVVNAPRPTNIDQLRSFMGLALYYSNFINNPSKILHPLNQLLHKNTPFNWTPDCEKAFQNIKNELCSDRILMPFDPDLPIILETDASPFGIAAILSQKHNNEIKPVTYISRTLTSAERNYSQMDKEATAIYWAVKKLYQYLYGNKFTLITDNKPLQTIFNPEKHLPTITALRLTRYALFLRQFEYQIKHRPGKEHQNVDYFSRVPLQIKSNENDDTYEVQQLIIKQLSTSPEISFNRIRQETERDPELIKLKEEILNPHSNGTQKIEYTIQSGIILRGNRVVIPTVLQPAILRELHDTHVGMVKMKGIARSTCYWKNIDKDIEVLVRSCSACMQNQKDPAKAPPHKWEDPIEPWTRVHADFAGPIHNKQFLIVIDALTKWVEVITFSNNPTSANTINAFKNIFSTHGIPYYLVTDNATIFKSIEFTEFCKVNSIKQVFSAPGHPATNGQAERTVQTFKYKLKAMLNSENTANIEELVRKFLFKYRTTPLLNGKTPAEMHFGRQIRTCLHMIKPAPVVNNKQQIEIRRNFKPGQRVLSRNYIGPRKWKLGIVMKQLGKLHYEIKLDSGYVIKRHLNQLRKCEYVEDENNQEETQISNKQKREKHVTFKLPTIQLTNNTYKNRGNQGRKDNSEVNKQLQREEVEVDNQSNDYQAERINDTNRNNEENKEVQVRRSQRIRKPVQRLNL